MFPHPLFLEYLIFFVFFTYLMSLKKNKRMLCYKGGMSVMGARKLVPSTWNILMLSARRHVQDKDTWENSSMGQGVRSQRKKCYKACT
jgi:hypothetical protein